MITSKKLSKQKKISHGFFNKNGGKSTGIYKSLNCGVGSKDKKSKVKKNLKIVKDKICKKTNNICYLLNDICPKSKFFEGIKAILIHLSVNQWCKFINN